MVNKKVLLIFLDSDFSLLSKNFPFDTATELLITTHLVATTIFYVSIYVFLCTIIVLV